MDIIIVGAMASGKIVAMAISDPDGAQRECERFNQLFARRYATKIPFGTAISGPMLIGWKRPCFFHSRLCCFSLQSSSIDHGWQKGKSHEV